MLPLQPSFKALFTSAGKAINLRRTEDFLQHPARVDAPVSCPSISENTTRNLRAIRESTFKRDKDLRPAPSVIYREDNNRPNTALHYRNKVIVFDLKPLINYRKLAFTRIH